MRDGADQLRAAQGAGNELPEWPEQVIGGKYVRLLQTQLDQLRLEARSSAGHGNRLLFLDDVFVVQLLAFFNPTVRTLRTIEDFSQTRQVQKHLTLRRICKSTLSDFHQLADPSRLEPILQALRVQVNRKQVQQGGSSDELATLLKQTVAVDGTFLPAVAEVAWAVANANNHGAVRHRARLDVHLNVDTWLPEAIVVPGPGQSEADSALVHRQDGRIYLYDRGYMSYALLAAHYDPDLEPRSHFLVRYREAGGNSPELYEDSVQDLTPEDRAAGVTSDRLGCFVTSHAARHPLPAITLREVVVEYEQDGQPQQLRLITNLLEVSAASVATLYRQRWQIELFFRWLKTFANFNHLLSHTREGVLSQFYVTIIAALLMYLHTGYRPSKYLFSLLSQVSVGAATLDEVLPILRERERQSAVARASAAKRAARKKQS